jgi:hypothetical protein
MIRAYRFFALAAAVTVSAVLISPCICAAQTSLRAHSFDVLIKGGMVYDGTGQTLRRADVGIRGDRIVAIGDLQRASAKSVIDATGLAVTPGFINMLSHSEMSLIADGRFMGELKQGVTTQIFGESSMGPLTDGTGEVAQEFFGDHSLVAVLPTHKEKDMRFPVLKRRNPLYSYPGSRQNRFQELYACLNFTVMHRRASWENETS